MKNNFLTILKTVVLMFTFTISFSSCKLNGTDTGNPVVDNNNGNQCGKMSTNTDYSTSCVLPPKPLQQSWFISKKLSFCFHLDEQVVYNNLNSQPELSKELMVDPDTYNQLHSLYQDRKIEIDLQAFDACLAAIEAIDCNSGLIQNSLNIQSESVDYTNVHSVLQADPSCKMVYSYK